jgi:GH24 family phage-related lysozyme (muramidase)
MADISTKAFNLILQFEGINQPGKWPGGGSGITIGYGYDLGFSNPDKFRSDWGSHLAPDTFTRLTTALGLTGNGAKIKAPKFADIRIDRDASLAVFQEKTIPEYVAQTTRAFPGFEQLPPDAQGALVSLVYNRGAGMQGDSRREMRAIRDAVPRGDLKEIANQLRLMKRLWVGKGLDGLLKRRDAEAALVESCIQK